VIPKKGKREEKSLPRHILIKLLETKDKENSKSRQEKEKESQSSNSSTNS
jgi:hypothetical protein